MICNYQQTRRIRSYAEVDDLQMCYWKTEEGWLLYIPRCGLGNLARHQVTEHDDGTITVRPSIKVTGHDQGRKMIRHGFISRGIWTGCSDDGGVL